MSRKQKKVAPVSQRAVDELFERADALLTQGLSGIETLLRGRLKSTRSKVDGLYDRWPGGTNRVVTAASQYVRNHPVQAAGLALGAGVVAMVVAGRQVPVTA